MAELTCKNIKITYIQKNKQFIDGLDGLSINFCSGGVTVIFGENGCGKTTLFNCITGLLAYDGEILFDGVNADELSIKERNIAYVQQNLSLFPKKTIFDNIAFPLKSQKLSPEEIVSKIYKVLRIFRISHLMNCLPSQISIGQLQKVCLAKAIVTEPKVLILDEAFSNLDPVTTESIQTIIKQYAKEKDIIVLYVTHSIKEGLIFGDYFKVMTKRGLTYDGTKENTTEDVLKRYVLGNG
ncbi:MAG: ABC transporter ATP-binding protein [Bacilli bacterium]|nr:ABC transporter ATP-binding protein [Bacilli bacterium]